MSRHITVFSNHGTYAGWPANHGAWQWGDEFLVGFLKGPWQDRGMHCIGQPFELMQARSKDGGESWSIEKTDIPVNDEAIYRTGPSTLDLRPGGHIIRVRGVYDHGGDYVDTGGGFYFSKNRGREWQGPFVFAKAQSYFESPYQNTSRTCVLTTSSGENLVFLSRAEQKCWGTDDVLVFKQDGDRFLHIGDLPTDDARCVMPAVAEIQGRIVAVCRRRKTGRSGGWVEAYGSDDMGRSWRKLVEVGVTGRNNGNPPALISDGVRLVCSYANRSDRQIIVRESLDRGESWSIPKVLRQGKESDIGYPRLFKRTDGNLVCVYYWADNSKAHQSIEATVFN